MTKISMDMIRHFYAMDGKDLFKGLKIWEDRTFIKEHYHKYPVLFATFKEVRGENWEKAENSLEELLRDLAARGLLSMEDSSDGMIKYFRKKYLEGEVKTYSRVLLALTKAFYRYYGTQKKEDSEEKLDSFKVISNGIAFYGKRTSVKLGV